MKKYTIEIAEASNDKTLLRFVIESKKSLAEAQEFFGKHGPSMFDLHIMLMMDEDRTTKRKTSIAMNQLVSMFEGEVGKDNCKVKFIVSNYDPSEFPKEHGCVCNECTKKKSTEEKSTEDDTDSKIEELIESLGGKAISIDGPKDMKKVLEILQLLNK